MKPELRDALARPFGPEMVRTKKGQGGRDMNYISHGGVTKRLNEVDPNWSAEMIERWITDTNGALHCVGGVMRLTIGDVTREEAGGPTRLGTLADDLKNTYSDCLKRCAMRFGVALDMWESAEENDEDAQPAPPPANQTARPPVAVASLTSAEVARELAPLEKQARRNDESLSPDEYKRYHALVARRAELHKANQSAPPARTPTPSPDARPAATPMAAGLPPAPAPLTEAQERVIAQAWEMGEGGDTYGATKALVQTLQQAASDAEWAEIRRRWFQVRQEYYPATIRAVAQAG